MPIDEVVEWASKTYVDASDLEPEEAAEIFSKALPPAEVDTPGDGGKKVTLRTALDGNRLHLRNRVQR